MAETAVLIALLLESGDGFLLEDGAIGLLLESAPTTGLPSEAALRYHPTERRRRR